MTVLIVLGAVLLFFVVLFSLNLKLDAAISDTTTIRAGLGPIMLTLSPKKDRVIDPDDFSYKKHQKRLKKDRKKAHKKSEKKRLKEEKKATKKAEAEKIKRDAEKAGTEIEKKKFPLGFILALIKFAFREIDVFIGYFRIEIKALHITVGGKDAENIGRTYGVISGALPFLIELLDHKTHLKKLKPDAVSVNADFLLEKTKFDAHIRLKLRLNSFLKVGIHALVWFIKQKIKEAKNAPSAGKTSVPAAKTKQKA